MTSKLFSSMSPRQRALAKLSCGVVGTIVAVNMLGYVMRGCTQMPNSVVSQNPAAYVSGLSEYIAKNPDKIELYQPELSGLIRNIDSLAGLPQQDRLFMFESNASKVPNELGIEVCDSSIIDKASADKQLEYLLGEVKETDARNYGTIMLEMGKKLGSDIYGSILSLFNKK